MISDRKEVFVDGSAFVERLISYIQYKCGIKSSFNKKTRYGIGMFIGDESYVLSWKYKENSKSIRDGIQTHNESGYLEANFNNLSLQKLWDRIDQSFLHNVVGVTASDSQKFVSYANGLYANSSYQELVKKIICFAAKSRALDENSAQMVSKTADMAIVTPNGWVFRKYPKEDVTLAPFQQPDYYDSDRISSKNLNEFMEDGNTLIDLLTPEVLYSDSNNPYLLNLAKKYNMVAISSAEAILQQYPGFLKEYRSGLLRHQNMQKDKTENEFHKNKKQKIARASETSDFRHFLLKQFGLEYKNIQDDGNCQFYAIAIQLLQVFPEKFPQHLITQLPNRDVADIAQKLRQIVIDHIRKNREFFETFFEDFSEEYEDFENLDDYLERLSIDKVWAGSMCFEVLSRVLERPVFLLHPDIMEDSVTMQEERVYFANSQENFDLNDAIILIFMNMQHYDTVSNRPPDNRLEIYVKNNWNHNAMQAKHGYVDISSDSYDSEDIESSQNTKEINVKYEYEDNDINAILYARLLEEIDDPKKLGDQGNIQVLGAIDAMTSNALEESIRNNRLQFSGERILLIPYNLGRYHWVGILLEFGENNQIKRSEYINSLGDSGFHELKNRLNNCGYPCDLKMTHLLSQHDDTSCGAYTIENLLLVVKNIESTQQPELNAQKIRLKHLECLKKFRQDFYDGFYERQRDNRSTVASLNTQLSYSKSQETQFTALELKKIFEISYNMSCFSNKEIRDKLWDIFQSKSTYTTHKDHLDNIRKAMVEVSITLGNENDCMHFKELMCLLFELKWDKNTIFTDVSMEKFWIEYEQILAIAERQAIDPNSEMQKSLEAAILKQIQEDKKLSQDLQETFNQEGNKMLEKKMHEKPVSSLNSNDSTSAQTLTLYLNAKKNSSMLNQEDIQLNQAIYESQKIT